MIEPIKIFYCNDIHGNSDYMAGMVFEARKYAKDGFVLSGGDNYSGADDKKNSFILDVMQNIMGVELSAVGNHELDNSSKGFFNAKNNIEFIVTNAQYSLNSPMNQIKKSIIKEKNGSKYGFVGAMPLDFDLVSKEINRQDIKVMNFEDSVKAIQNEVNNLKKQNINKIIMLSHSGYETDKKYAQALDGVDIIIGAHCHSLIKDVVKGENLLTSKSGEPVLIVQAGENAKHYGIANVEFKNGILNKVQNIVLENTCKTRNLLIEYLKDLKLGKSPVVTYIKEIEPMPQCIRTTPCAWTNLIADSMREHFDTDIAIVNAPNIRKVPVVGKLTERDIVESAPMKNDLLVTKVTEKQLVDAIKNSSKKTMNNKNGKPGLLHVSGMTYKIDTQGNLLHMTIGDNTIDINNPSNKQYTACYDTFVAKKDGEYPELVPPFPVQSFTYDKDQTTIEYLKDEDEISVINDNRLQIVKSLNILV